MMRVFIRTNKKQILGGMLGKHAILRTAAHPEQIEVRYMVVDDMPLFRDFQGKTYKRHGETITYDINDLQSFTLSAFMAPELAGYEGRAMVIDPDIFALADVEALFNRDLQGKALAARPKRGVWDTSVMMLDCAKLRHWNMKKILEDLAAGRTTYEEWMSLKNEQVQDLEAEWNSWDVLVPETKLLHTTNRLTQPWRAGLKVDFTRNRMPKLFGVIPREWIARLRGTIPSRYQEHPDPKIRAFFFELVRDALAKGAVTEDVVRAEIAAGHVRTDLFEQLKAPR
ncbi:MAG: hypothetical protein QY323_06200 [Patescibacteria group bacterium]|nr:MAG: hypothetical protein QY323_06200 [Patescibacteria group bacterium]